MHDRGRRDLEALIGRRDQMVGLVMRDDLFGEFHVSAARLLLDVDPPRNGRIVDRTSPVCEGLVRDVFAIPHSLGPRPKALKFTPFRDSAGETTSDPPRSQMAA